MRKPVAAMSDADARPIPKSASHGAMYMPKEPRVPMTRTATTTRTTGVTCVDAYPLAFDKIGRARLVEGGCAADSACLCKTESPSWFARMEFQQTTGF